MSSFVAHNFGISAVYFSAHVGFAVLTVSDTHCICLNIKKIPLLRKRKNIMNSNRMIDIGMVDIGMILGWMVHVTVMIGIAMIDIAMIGIATIGRMKPVNPCVSMVQHTDEPEGKVAETNLF